MMLLFIGVSLTGFLMLQTPARAQEIMAKSHDAHKASYAGLDEAVNEHLAAAAGRPARAPYINTEAMGDLWNLLLLGAGGVCGFIVGRYCHLLWGAPQPETQATACETAR